jgi:hypothetical protein
MTQLAADTTMAGSEARYDAALPAPERARQSIRLRWAAVGFALGTGLCVLSCASWADEDGPAARLRGKLWVSPVDYVECSSETAFARGDIVMLTGSGLAPNETAEITFRQGETELSLGPIKTNAIGALNARFPIPSDAATDQDAQFRASAEHGANGGGIVLSSSHLQIFADNRDSDGDGIKDMCDTCPELASDDLIDMDADGLGDPCDPCPTDPENGAAGDGKCADDNPNPLVPLSQPKS